jgi:CarD family transcriptional regulator
VKGRGATAPHPAAARRPATPPPAKAARALAATKAAEPPAKSAKVAPAKAAVAKPAAKVAAPIKQAPTKPEIKPAPRQVAPPSQPVRPAPAAPLQTVQQKPTTVPPRPPAPQMQAAGDRRPPMPDRIPPRQPAKAEIFVEGDHVVYPTHGVGKVERIATEEIAGHKLELIHITFEENRMTLRVPVAKARSAGLRKLATRKLFDEALAVLKGRARIKRTMWSRRAQEYEAKINSGDPLSIAEVVRDLHRNAGQPDQSFSERQIYEAAMDRLAAELAALDKTDKLTAAIKLTNFLKTV